MSWLVSVFIDKILYQKIVAFYLFDSHVQMCTQINVCMIELPQGFTISYFFSLFFLLSELPQQFTIFSQLNASRKKSTRNGIETKCFSLLKKKIIKKLHSTLYRKINNSRGQLLKREINKKFRSKTEILYIVKKMFFFYRKSSIFSKKNSVFWKIIFFLLFFSTKISVFNRNYISLPPKITFSLSLSLK